jgi:hypothetical protein
MSRFWLSNTDEKPDFSPSRILVLPLATSWIYNDATKPAVWIDHEPSSLAANAAKAPPEAPHNNWVASSWHESTWSLFRGLDVIDPVPQEHIPAAWMEAVCS